MADETWHAKSVIFAARRADDLVENAYAGETPDTCRSCKAAIMVGPRTHAKMTELPAHAWTLVCIQCLIAIRVSTGAPVLSLGNTPLDAGRN